MAPKPPNPPPPPPKNVLEVARRMVAGIGCDLRGAVFGRPGFFLSGWLLKSLSLCLSLVPLGDRIRGTLGDIDPLNKVPVSESQKRVKKGFPFKAPPYPT